MDMRLAVLAASFFLLLAPELASAATSDRQVCEAAIKELGYRPGSYSFKEGGLLGSDVHQFGDLNCIVSSDHVVQSIKDRGVILANNGVVGPNFLLLREVAKQSRDALVARASEERRKAVSQAEAEFETKRGVAHKQEDMRVAEVNQLFEVAMQSIRDGKPRKPIFERMGINVDDPKFQKKTSQEISRLVGASAEKSDQEKTWSDLAKSYVGGVWSYANSSYSDPSALAADLKSGGHVLIQKSKEGANSVYKAVVEKSGDVYDLITGGGLCKRIQVINSGAVSYVGGAVSGLATGALFSKASRTLLVRAIAFGFSRPSSH